MPRASKSTGARERRSQKQMRMAEKLEEYLKKILRERKEGTPMEISSV